MLSTAKEKRSGARPSNGEVERRTVKNCIGQTEFCFGIRRTAEALRGDAYLGNAMDQQRVEKYSSGGEEASNVQQSSGEARHRMARQRNGKVKSRRAQKRRGEGTRGEALFGNGIEMNRSAMDWHGAAHRSARAMWGLATGSKGLAQPRTARQWNSKEMRWLATETRSAVLR